MSSAESRAQASPLTIGSVVDGYRIEEVLGHGGMGYVYGVVNNMIGKRAAMKVLRSELSANHDMLQRFITEARAVNQIGHPNIVDIFGFGTIGDDHYMVMEWLKGESLGDRMGMPLPREEACDILLAIASALEAAHAAGIAHRDLKPDNVFLVRTGKGTTVKLLDFGIAKLLTTNSEMQKTQTGMVMGTPAYMSPEQARGKDVDQRTDIYSLGIMAFEMFCRRPPFSGETAMDLVVAHIHEPAPAPSSIVETVSPAIDALVLSMLEKDAAARPSLQQILAALEEIRGGSDMLSTMPPRRAARSAMATTSLDATKPRRKWWLAAIVATGVAIGAVVTVVATRKDDATNPEATPLPPPPVAAPAITPAIEPPPTPPPVAPPVADEVTIEVKSTPSGASVRLAGTTEVLGTTPFSKTFPRSNETQTFELQLDGFQPGTQVIAMAKDAMVQLALVPVAKAKPQGKPKQKPKVDRGGTMNVFDD